MMLASLVVALFLVCQHALGQAPTWHEFEGSLYFIAEDSESVLFDTARSSCQSYGGDLAFITSQEINDFLSDLISSSSSASFLIGLTDRETEDEFKWLDGSPLIYDNWNVGEPNNGNNEDCVVLMRNGRWNDVLCHEFHAPYICGSEKYIFQLSSVERTNPGTARVSCAVTAQSLVDALSSDDIMVSVGSAFSSSRLVSISSTTVVGNTRNNTYFINDLGEKEYILCFVYDMENGLNLSRQFSRPDHFQLPVLNSYPGVTNFGANFVTVAWTRWSTCSDSGEGPVIGYNIYVRPRNEGWTMAGHVNALLFGLDQSIFYFNVTDLEPDTEYSLSVSAIREGTGGEGNLGLETRARTSSSELRFTDYNSTQAIRTPSPIFTSSMSTPSPPITPQQGVSSQALLSWILFGVAGIGDIIFITILVFFCLKRRQDHSKREAAESHPYMNPTFDGTDQKEHTYEGIRESSRKSEMKYDNIIPNCNRSESGY